MYKLALSISLFLAPLWLVAQTAEDYFHGGAQYYIWGDKTNATEQIYTGLQKFPTDPQLNGLAALLKKEEQKQQQQQNKQDQDKKDQDKKDQQNKDQENKKDQAQQNKSDQNKDSQQQKEQQQKEQAQKDKEKQKQSAEQKKKEEQAQQSSGKPDDKEKQEGQQTYAVGQMTPHQAQQLLDAQKGQEMMLPVKPEGKPRDPNKPLRDW